VRNFYRRYLVGIFLGFPVGLGCVGGLLAVTGAEGVWSALIGLAVGVVLLLVGAVLAFGDW
jgi:hypothetical protein